MACREPANKASEEPAVIADADFGDSAKSRPVSAIQSEDEMEMVRRANEVLGINHVGRWMRSRIPSLGNEHGVSCWSFGVFRAAVVPLLTAEAQGSRVAGGTRPLSMRPRRPFSPQWRLSFIRSDGQAENLLGERLRASRPPSPVCNVVDIGV